jgi:predicted permease
MTAAFEVANLAWRIVGLRLHLNVLPITQVPSRRAAPQPRASMASRGWRDVKSATRSLAANRLNTAIALFTLAFGIGVNTSVFSVLDSVLWRPVPFRDADHLIELANFNVVQKFTYAGMSRGLTQAWRQQGDLFDRVEAVDRSSFVYRDDRGATMVPGAIISPGLLKMLGVPARAGRVFTDADGRGGTDRIAVISDDFWRSTLHGDRNVIGQRLTIDDAGYEVVGVMPATFRFPDDRTAIWLPYNLDAPPPDRQGSAINSAAIRWMPIARERASLSIEQLRSQVVARGATLSESSGGPAGVSAAVMTLEFALDERTQRSLVVLAAAVAFLLLIVCANLASLALSRSIARARDLAVCAALGASRGDLVRAAVVESALLGAIGAVGGATLAAGFLQIVRTVLPDAVSLSTLNPIDLDGRALACAGVLGLATAVLFGLPPAYLASRTAVADLLRWGGRSIAGHSGSQRFRGALVVAEVAMAMVLLVAAALMTRSLIKLNQADRGLDPAGLVAVRLGLPVAGYQDLAMRDQFAKAVTERLRHVPGVRAAGVGVVPPQTDKILFGNISIDGGPDEPERLLVPAYDVSADFFATLRLPFKAGHTFPDHDLEPSAIVSESFARAHWPRGDAINKQFRVGDDDARTVIGIVGDVIQVEPGARARRTQVYLPLGQTRGLAAPVGPASAIAEYRTLVLRTDDPAAVVSSLPAAIHEVDPSVVVWKIDLVEHLFADAIARPRIVFVLMSVFAIFGLILAAAGIYGVLSYLVALRAREIGIRLALGARPSTVGLLVVRSGLALTVTGLVIGLAAALALVRVMRTLLYQVEPSDPTSVTIVVAVLTTAALVACLRPARQAMRVDPLTLLREG